MRKRACEGKKPLSEQQARSTAIALSKKQGVRMNAYKCPFCYLPSGKSAWHVGHAQRLRTRFGR